MVRDESPTENRDRDPSPVARRVQSGEIGATILAGRVKRAARVRRDGRVNARHAQRIGYADRASFDRGPVCEGANCAAVSRADRPVRSVTAARAPRAALTRGSQIWKIFAVWLAFCSLLAPSCSVNGDKSARGTDSRERVSPSTSPTPPDGCPNCYIPHDAIREHTLEAIRYSILDKLGLSQPPNVTKRLPATESMFISKYMMDRMNKQEGQHLRHRPDLHDIQGDQSQIEADDDDDDRLRNMHMVAVARKCSGTPYCRKYKTHNPVIFVFEQKTTKAKVLSARLSFYQKQLSLPPDIEAKVNVTIFKSTTASTKGRSTHQYAFLLTTEEELSQTGRWIEIDIKEQLEKHFKEDNALNLSLVIIATHPNKEIVSKLVTEIKHEEEPLYPFLQIQMEEQHSRRRKRSNHMDCTDGDKYTKCCRYPLIVDFQAFKWNFIIAPNKYEAYYCAGECGPLSYQKYPHTQLASMATPLNNTPYPYTACCGPRKMGAISILYYGEDGINMHHANIPGMVVHRCGCA